MKTLASYLFALALVVVLTPPYLLAAPKIDGVTVTVGGGGGAGYLVEEDFEETGLPGPATWAVEDGTLSWDSTTHINLSGQALSMTSNSPVAVASVAFAAQSDVWMACKFEVNAGISYSTALSLLGFRTSALGARCLIQADSGNKVKLWVDGGADPASVTFTLSVDTLYYVWIHYSGGGTCAAYISTTPTRPSLGTDTATQWADSKADATNTDVEKVTFRGHSGFTVSHYFDEVFVSTSELTNPWGE